MRREADRLPKESQKMRRTIRGEISELCKTQIAMIVCFEVMQCHPNYRTILLNRRGRGWRFGISLRQIEENGDKSVFEFEPLPL